MAAPRRCDQAAVLQDRRRTSKRSCGYGDVDCELTSPDVVLLSPNRRPLEDHYRRQGLPQRPCKSLHQRFGHIPLTPPVCCPFSDCTPQSRPICAYHHRAPVGLLALHLDRAHPIRHIETCRHNCPCTVARYPVLLRTIFRYRAHNSPLSLQRHPYRLGFGACCGQCATEAARLERRLRRMV